MRRAQLPVAAAFFVPFLAGIWHQQAALYRTDRAVLHLFGDEPGLSGSLSILLGRLAGALPLGDALGRATCVSAFAMGIAGTLIFFLAMKLLRKEGSSSGHDPWLAVGASWIGTATLPALTESTAFAGGAVGLCLGLAWVALESPRPQTEGSSRFGDGALRGVLAVGLAIESLPLALALFLCAFLPRLLGGFGRLEIYSVRPHDRRVEPSALGFSCGALGLFVLLLVSEVLGARDQGLASIFRLAFPTLTADSGRAGLLWPVSELGFLWSGGALVGAFLLASRRSRALWTPLGLFLIDWGMERSTGDGWLSMQLEGARSSLHLTAIAFLALLGALGLRSMALLGPAIRMPGGQISAVLLTTLGVAASFAGVEEAESAARRVNTLAIRMSGDELLRGLPSDSLVVTHSVDLSRRLRAVQAQGERPDVLIVPLALLGDPYRFGALVRREPALDGLVIDLHVTGTPSEEALYRLTDVRPVFVEPDPRWAPRLLGHLEPTPLLARYSPHTLSGPERRLIYAEEEGRFRVLVGVTHAGVEGDETTRTLLMGRHQALREAIQRAGDSATAELMALATL